MLRKYKNLCCQTPITGWIVNTLIGGLLGPAIYAGLVAAGSNFNTPFPKNVSMLVLPSLITMALLYPSVRQNLMAQPLTKKVLAGLSFKYAFRSYYFTVLIFAVLNLLLMPAVALGVLMAGAILFFLMIVPLFIVWAIYLLSLNEFIKVQSWQR